MDSESGLLGAESDDLCECGWPEGHTGPCQAGESTPRADTEAKSGEPEAKDILPDGTLDRGLTGAYGESLQAALIGIINRINKGEESPNEIAAALAPSSPSEGEGAREADPRTEGILRAAQESARFESGEGEHLYAYEILRDAIHDALKLSDVFRAAVESQAPAQEQKK